MSKKHCAIFGVGPGNGMSIARRFSDEGYAVSLAARRADALETFAGALGNANGYVCDVTDASSISDAVAAMERDHGPIDALIYNAGSGAWGSVDDVSPDDLRRNLDVNAVGLLTSTQAALPGMRARGTGSILVIGASAAMRGRAGTIAFAAGKAAQRSVAQSLARKLGPENIHVAYLVLDGVIDLETTRARMSDKPDTFFLTADGVADACWSLHNQDRQAWTFELDLRPFAENW